MWAYEAHTPRGREHPVDALKTLKPAPSTYLHGILPGEPPRRGTVRQRLSESEFEVVLGPFRHRPIRVVDNIAVLQVCALNSAAVSRKFAGGRVEVARGGGSWKASLTHESWNGSP